MSFFKSIHAVVACFAEVFLLCVSAGFSFRYGMVCSVLISLNQRVVALLNDRMP